MAQVSGAGTIWNLPNYVGELYTADAINTPFLSMIGGMTGGRVAQNFEFPVSSEYDFPSATQPAVTETTSLTAPTATEGVRTQVKNVCQIFHQAVNISYEKLAGQGRLTGINTAGTDDSIADEVDWQIEYNMRIIARNVEYSFLNGSYQIATSAAVANKTRGLFEAASDASNTVAAGSADLTKDMIQELLRTMAGNGAMFMNPVIMVNAFQKQKLSDIYGYAPEDRMIGGVNVNQIYTDFGIMGVVYNRFVPAASLIVADAAVCSPVFQEVPGKGLLFYEDLAKTGAAEQGQIFGKIGLDHGPEWMHGSITGLATS